MSNKFKIIQNYFLFMFNAYARLSSKQNDKVSKNFTMPKNTE